MEACAGPVKLILVLWSLEYMDPQGISLFNHEKTHFLLLENLIGCGGTLEILLKKVVDATKICGGTSTSNAQSMGSPHVALMSLLLRNRRSLTTRQRPTSFRMNWARFAKPSEGVGPVILLSFTRIDLHHGCGGVLAASHSAEQGDCCHENLWRNVNFDCGNKGFASAVNGQFARCFGVVAASRVGAPSLQARDPPPLE